MAFELTEFNEVRLVTVTNRIEKHGQDDKPAVTLTLELKTENTVLDSLDPALRQTLFLPKGGDAQEPLEGVPEVRPVLACNSIKSVTLPNKHDGWTLEIDHSGNEHDAFKFGGCKLGKFSCEPIQGGSVALRFSVGTSDLDQEKAGWIGMHPGELIYIRLLAPQKKDDAIDGTGAEFNKDHPLLDQAEHACPQCGCEDTTDEGEDGRGCPDCQHVWKPGQSAADTFAANEAAGLNKDASEVPPEPKKKRGRSNRPSLTPVE